MDPISLGVVFVIGVGVLIWYTLFYSHNRNIDRVFDYVGYSREDIYAYDPSRETVKNKVTAGMNRMRAHLAQQARNLADAYWRDGIIDEEELDTICDFLDLYMRGEEKDIWNKKRVSRISYTIHTADPKCPALPWDNKAVARHISDKLFERTADHLEKIKLHKEIHELSLKVLSGLEPVSQSRY